MPSIPSQIQDSIRATDVRYLRFYYPLASYLELNSDLGRTWYTSCLKRFKNNRYHKERKIHYNFNVCLYKRQLLEELIKRGITFDDYRAGRTEDIDIWVLKARFDIPPEKDIYIHECDYVHFQLHYLEILEPFINEPFPYVYQYYNCTKRTEQFKGYMNKLKRQLNRQLLLMNLQAHLDLQPPQTQIIDCRLPYDVVLK